MAHPGRTRERVIDLLCAGLSLREVAVEAGVSGRRRGGGGLSVAGWNLSLLMVVVVACSIRCLSRSRDGVGFAVRSRARTVR